MKKNYLLAVALAIMTMASCSDNDFVGDQRALNAENEGAISFAFDVPTQTRAGGSDAATALSNQFIVWGEKNEASGSAATAGNLVFKNYIVRWTDNSAYTTTSNTKNWEYVGYEFDNDGISPVTSNYSTNITPNTKDVSVIPQTIKYWDYAATSYTFTAVSAKPSDISDGKVTITKNTSGTTVYDKGYEIAVKSGATVDKIYVADRNQPTVGTGTDRNATNTYGGNVTMQFRNFMSKIRFGLYETIPGYKVNITNVEYNSTGSSSTSKFGVDGKFLTPGANTAFTVTYGNGLTTGPLNKAIVDVKDGTTPNDQAYLETAQNVAGSPILSTSPASPVSTVITSPTYDKTAGAYTTILPYSSNTTNMKVKFDFTLTSEDTGETINVSDATAEIPAAYCQWKSNYAYTYILKLNDNTNGQIGGVTGLYPITFDAVEITDENGNAEFITTVSEPSITTFGVNSSTGAYVTGGSEYAAGSDIYATFVEGSTVQTPVLGTSGAKHVNIYHVTTPDATNFRITEAAVAEAIANPASATVDVYTRSGDPGSYTYTKVTDVTTLTSGTTYYKADGESKIPGADGYIPTEAVAGSDYTPAPKLTVVNINSDASSYFTAAPSVVSTVPSEDGNTVTIDAVKLTGVKATTTTTAIAIEYEASGAWTGSYKKVYKVIRVQ